MVSQPSHKFLEKANIIRVLDPIKRTNFVCLYNARSDPDCDKGVQDLFDRGDGSFALRLPVD